MFNQKENGLLQDLKSEEQLCIEKYTKCENNAVCPGLKSLFGGIRSQEQTHLQTISQLIDGTIPQMQGGGSTPTASCCSSDYASDPEGFKNDKYLCEDTLSTEKHVSSMYNTSIFEFKSTAVRDLLNHIQKEEQQHGEQIYSFMNQNGMYS